METERGERFTVRLADEEIEVEGLDALLNLARSSRLSPTTRVRREGQEDWILAERIPALRLHFSANSWDGLEGIQVDDGPAIEAPTELVDLPEGALEIMSEPVESCEEPPSVEDLPTGALTPVAPQMVIHSDNRSKRRRKEARERMEPVRPDPAGPISTSGEVIEFPVGAGPETGGVEGSNPVLEALERLEKSVTPPPPQTPGARWAGLGLFALMMFGGIGLISWYMSTTAQARYPEVPDDPQVQQVQSEIENDDYVALEIELREALSRRSETFDVSRGPQVDKNDQDQRVGEAMEQDLQFQMKVSPGLQVIADVLSFKNGSDRMPRELGLQITLYSSEERLDHDLGAVGLVVGRFITDYNLEVVRSKGLSNHFKLAVRLGNGGPLRQFEMDYRETRKLYKQSLSLQDFLATVR
jgi:hypothetical protein